MVSVTLNLEPDVDCPALIVQCMELGHGETKVALVISKMVLPLY